MMVPVKPFSPVTVTVEVAVPLWVIVRDEGLAAISKPAWDEPAVTLTSTLAVRVTSPPIPFTVTM